MAQEGERLGAERAADAAAEAREAADRAKWDATRGSLSGQPAAAADAREAADRAKWDAARAAERAGAAAADAREAADRARWDARAGR